MNDEELIAIYNEANGIFGGKKPPISTQRIFAAMRLVAARQREKDAEICDSFATIEGIAQKCAAAIREQGDEV